MGDDAWSSWILSAKGLISFSSPREEVHEVQIEIVRVVNKLLSSTIPTKQESSFPRIKMFLCWLLFALGPFSDNHICITKENNLHSVSFSLQHA